MSGSVPEIWIERVALGEATEEQTRAVKAALGDEFEARMAALRADDEAIRAEVPPGRVANEVARRLRAAQADEAPSSTPARWWIPAGALAAAAALVLLWVRPGDDDDPDGDPIIATAETSAVDDTGPEQIYLKGDARLVIEQVDGGRTKALAADAVVDEGTRLQVSDLAADRAEGVIVSIDGRGEATLHFPATVDATPTLKSGGKTALDHSYELDDAPKYERFFFVTASEGTPIDVADVLEAARALARQPDAADGVLKLPTGLDQTSITLRKP